MTGGWTFFISVIEPLPTKRRRQRKRVRDASVSVAAEGVEVKEGGRTDGRGGEQDAKSHPRSRMMEGG